MFVKSELAIIRAAMKDFLEKTQHELHQEGVSELEKQAGEQLLIQSMAIKNKITNLIPEVAPNADKLHEKDPVLVVDDDMISREMAVNSMWEMGFANVHSAKDGFEAQSLLKKLQSQNQEVKLILCDWNMPKMSGLELLKIVRKDAVLWDVPFFLITANRDKAHILTAIKSGVSGYIMKPVAHAQLVEKLKRYIPG
jgi:two-component system chemotaxis response regulator CheY